MRKPKKNNNNPSVGEQAPLPPPLSDILPPPTSRGPPNGNQRDPEKDILTRFKSQKIIRDAERETLTRFRSQQVLSASGSKPGPLSPPPLGATRPGAASEKDDPVSLRSPQVNSLRSSGGLNQLALPLRKADLAEVEQEYTPHKTAKNSKDKQTDAASSGCSCIIQ